MSGPNSVSNRLRHWTEVDVTKPRFNRLDSTDSVDWTANQIRSVHHVLHSHAWRLKFRFRSLTCSTQRTCCLKCYWKFHLAPKIYQMAFKHCLVERWKPINLIYTGLSSSTSESLVRPLTHCPNILIESMINPILITLRRPPPFEPKTKPMLHKPFGFRDSTNHHRWKLMCRGCYRIHCYTWILVQELKLTV